IFAYRSNVIGVPVQRGGTVVGFRSAGKSGVPDITAILPPVGTSFYVEVKTGKDRLRPEQIGFIASAEKCGSRVLVVKDFADFQAQFLKCYPQFAAFVKV